MHKSPVQKKQSDAYIKFAWERLEKTKLELIQFFMFAERRAVHLIPRTGWAHHDIGLLL